MIICLKKYINSRELFKRNIQRETSADHWERLIKLEKECNFPGLSIKNKNITTLKTLISTRENELKQKFTHKTTYTQKYGPRLGKNQKHESTDIVTHQNGIPIPNVPPENRYVIIAKTYNRKKVFIWTLSAKRN